MFVGIRLEGINEWGTMQGCSQSDYNQCCVYLTCYSHGLQIQSLLFAKNNKNNKINQRIEYCSLLLFLLKSSWNLTRYNYPPVQLSDSLIQPNLALDSIYKSNLMHHFQLLFAIFAEFMSIFASSLL